MSRSIVDNRRTSGTAGRTAAALLLVVAGFQASLAAGAPWGAAAYGGSNPGVLPNGLRTGSAVAAVVYVLLAVVAGASAVGTAVRRPVLRVTAATMAVGAVANLASPSPVERLIWTPVTVALVIALWREARHLTGP